MSITKTITTTALLATLAFTSQGCLSSGVGITPQNNPSQETIEEVTEQPPTPEQLLEKDMYEAIKKSDFPDGELNIGANNTGIVTVGNLVFFDLETPSYNYLPLDNHVIGIYNKDAKQVEKYIGITYPADTMASFGFNLVEGEIFPEHQILTCDVGYFIRRSALPPGQSNVFCDSLAIFYGDEPAILYYAEDWPIKKLKYRPEDNMFSVREEYW